MKKEFDIDKYLVDEHGRPRKKVKKGTSLLAPKEKSFTIKELEKLLIEAEDEVTEKLYGAYNTLKDFGIKSISLKQLDIAHASILEAHTQFLLKLRK